MAHVKQVSVRVVASGLVQGVGFRWFVREQARALELAGWVRNRADGALELAVQGEEPAIDALVFALWQGPPGARVTTVEMVPAADGDEFPDPFTIHRPPSPQR